MTTESLHSNPEDIFAKAIERVEAGEAVEAVLTTVPEPMRAELRDVLLLITATHHLQRAPVPQPSAQRRSDRKRAFLEAAAQMKAETALTPTPVAAPTLVARPQPAPPPLWAGLANFWRDLQASFAVPNLRLAPLIMLIVAVYLGAFGFVSAASAAEIGDPAYVFKQWMRDQKFNLSSVAARGAVYNENIQEFVADLQATAANLQDAEASAPPRLPMITQRIMIDDVNGDYLVSGPLRILMRYQPDPSVDTYTSMSIPVMPGKEQFADVTFQIVPSADPNSEQPYTLQGIALVVLEVQPTMGPTPTPEPAATSTATATTTPCEFSRPAGWVPYSVRAGDTLSAIAQRTGTTVEQLQQVNCLPDANAIGVDNRLFAPALAPASTPTAAQPTLAATLTAISTTVLTPSIDITATATVVPTATVTLAMTPPSITTTVTPTATAVITDPISQTPTAVHTPTPPMTVTVTISATSEPTAEGTLSATATPVAPTAEVTGTVEPDPSTPMAPTVTTTMTPNGSTTATATTDSTPAPTTVPPETPLASATPTPAVADTPTAVVMPTATADSTGGKDGNTDATPPPTSDGSQGGGGSGPVVPTPTNTPIPQNKSPLTGG